MRVQGRTAVGVSLVLALSLATAACGGTGAKPAASTASPAKTAAPSTAPPAKTGAASTAPPAATGTTHVTVVMSYILTGFDAPFWVGINRGYYKQQHLSVSPSPGKATFESVQAVANGAATFGQLDGGTVMKAVSQGLPLLGVGQLFTSQPFAIVAPASSGIKTIADLRGKKLGDAAGNATAQLLPGVLAYNHMTVKDLHMVDMDNNALIPALLSHRVNAIAALTIGQMPAIELKGMKVRALLYSDSGLNQPGFGIYTTKAYAAAHPGVVKRFDLATREAMVWTKQHQKQAVDILAKYFPSANKKLLTMQLQVSLPLWANPPVGPFSMKQYKTAEQELVKYGVLKKPVDVTTMITNKYVPS